MSGFTRTLQKRIMKRRGLSRNLLGFITDKDGESYGRQWPRFLPKAEAPKAKRRRKAAA